MSTETFGAALRRARTDLGLTLREFTDVVVRRLRQLGYTTTLNHVAVWRLERGLSTTVATELAEAFDHVAGTGDELQRKAKQLAPTTAVIAQIPPSIPGFIGRRHEWEHLEALLGDGPDEVLEINGAPGVGKTTAVVQWYHSAAQRIADRFPGGVVWVDLRGHDGAPVHPDAALETILQALRVPASSIPTQGAKRAKFYRDRCARQPVLVLLDNAVQAEQVLPLLPPPGDCRAVVTSRQRLDRLRVDRGARSLAMAPLAAQEAQDFLRHHGGTRIDDDPESAAAVARFCGNLPLALGLASAYLDEHPQQPVRVLRERLERETDRLNVLRSADGEPEIRRAFELSYEALPPETREVFRYLGLHPSPEFSVGAAAVLVDRPIAETRHHLEALTSAGLLEEIGPDRHRVHDLLRVYAAERAQQEETDLRRSSAVEQVLAHYLKTAAAATRSLFPQARLPFPVDEQDSRMSHWDATQWLTVERPNLHAAAQLAFRRGDLVLTWHLAVAQGSEASTGRTAWQDAHLLGLRVARESADLLGAAWCMYRLGLHHWQLREWSDASRYLRQALEYWRKIPDWQGESWTLWALVNLSADKGDIHWALQMCHELLDPTAVRVYQYLVDQWGEEMDPHQLALELYQRLLDSGVGDYLHATIQASMGEAFCRLPIPNPEGAVGLLHQALQYFSAQSTPKAEAVTLMRLGEAWRLLGNPDRALRMLNRSYTCYIRIADQSGIAPVLLQQAHIHRELGDLQRAHKAASAAYSLFTDWGDPRQADAATLLSALSQAA